MVEELLCRQKNSEFYTSAKTVRPPKTTQAKVLYFKCNFSLTWIWMAVVCKMESVSQIVKIKFELMISISETAQFNQIFSYNQIAAANVECITLNKSLKTQVTSFTFLSCWVIKYIWRIHFSTHLSLHFNGICQSVISTACISWST